MPHLSDSKRGRARELRSDMTPTEAILWQHLRAHRMAGLHFRRQQVLHGFIVDYYCQAARLIIEVDGPIHNQQRAADEERDAILTANGLRILRVTNDEVTTNLQAVLARIRSYCVNH